MLQHVLFVHGLFLQLVSSLLTAQLAPPRVSREQLVPTIRHVELWCFVAPQEFISSLSYNLLLVSACTFYALRTRKLPDNYNESRFIGFCVYTTIVMWMAFVPSYYIVNRLVFRVLLLSIAMTFNGIIALLCMFVVKVYAVCYVPDVNLRIASRGTGQVCSSNAVHSSRNATKVTNIQVQSLSNPSAEFVQPD